VDELLFAPLFDLDPVVFRVVHVDLEGLEQIVAELHAFQGHTQDEVGDVVVGVDLHEVHDLVQEEVQKGEVDAAEAADGLGFVDFVECEQRLRVGLAECSLLVAQHLDAHAVR